jgi:SAM-dependent methyltransferase
MGLDDMNDKELDALLPTAVRQASSRYWTPVEVARRAAEILKGLGVRRLLDVGSGPGKFCVVAGARAPAIEFVGLEHRARLVDVAQKLASRLETNNVTFALGDATSFPWDDFDAFYVFNSFTENVFSRLERFDQTVELSHVRRVTEVMRVKRRLDAAPEGTVLQTYYGLGGPIPRSYDLLSADAVGTGWLRTWRKARSEPSDRYWLEDDDSVSVLTLREVIACMRDDADEDTRP